MMATSDEIARGYYEEVQAALGNDGIGLDLQCLTFLDDNDVVKLESNLEIPMKTKFRYVLNEVRKKESENESAYKKKKSRSKEIRK